MQPTAILLALFAATGLASPLVEPRQANLGGIPPDADSPFAPRPSLADAERRLTQIRNDAVAQIRGGSGRGRQLIQAPCGANCMQCRNSSVAIAVSEVLACGVAGLGISAASGPLAVFVEVTLFALCESAAVSTLNKAEAECTSMG